MLKHVCNFVENEDQYPFSYLDMLKFGCVILQFCLAAAKLEDNEGTFQDEYWVVFFVLDRRGLMHRRSRKLYANFLFKTRFVGAEGCLGYSLSSLLFFF